METPFIRIQQLHPGRGNIPELADALDSHPKYHTLAISKINCHTDADITISLVHGLLYPLLRKCRVIHWRPFTYSLCHCYAPVRKYEEFFDNSVSPPLSDLVILPLPAPKNLLLKLPPYSISPASTQLCFPWWLRLGFTNLTYLNPYPQFFKTHLPYTMPHWCLAFSWQLNDLGPQSCILFF